MKSIIRINDDAKFEVSYGEGVPLPNDKYVCEIVRFARSGETCVCYKHSSAYRAYSPRLRECTDADTLERELRRPTSQKVGDRQSIEQPCNLNIHDRQCLAKDCDLSGIDLADDAIKAIDGDLFDLRTGEIIGRCKTLDNVRRTWSAKRHEILNSVLWTCSCLVTATLGGEPTFDQISKATAKFARWLGNRFSDGYVCAFAFIEPHKDGCWHVHIIVGFLNCIPDDFAVKTQRWWDKQNKRQCDEQVDVMPFDSREHLEQVIQYLNPTSKDKRERIKFYPLNSQPMRAFGNFSAPNKALASFEVAQEILGDEMPAFRRQVRVIDSNTQEELFFKAEFMFAPKTPSVDVTEPPFEYFRMPLDFPDRFACTLECAGCHCSDCVHNGRCDDCLGVICGNLCSDCWRNIANVRIVHSVSEMVEAALGEQVESGEDEPTPR